MSPTDHEIEFEPGSPNHDEACMVCDKLDCVCPAEPMTYVVHEQPLTAAWIENSTACYLVGGTPTLNRKACLPPASGFDPVSLTAKAPLREEAP